MAYESAKIQEIVDRAVNHNWSIPEFQRGFVWKATQVRDLAESLWLDFPIGSLLVWDSKKSTEERTAIDAQRPSQWVVDGQQRATALAILFGRKPYWWPGAEEWDKTLKKYDIRFDVDAKAPPYFVVANAVIRSHKGDRYIPLSRLLNLDPEKRSEDQNQLMELARKVKSDALCSGMDAMEVYTRLHRICKIRDKDVVTITVDHDLEEVVEIFSRLNSKGTRVTEADIYLGIVAARTPGWVRTTFLPYLNQLQDAGFDLNPNLLFRTITGVGAKRVRFKEIPDDFWQETNIRASWDKTKSAWEDLIYRFKEYGILSNDPMPTQAALVIMVALLAKFPNDSFEPALYWFLQASRAGRYSASSATSLDEDLRNVYDADSLLSAVRKLLKRFPHEPRMNADEFMADYGDGRFGRFMLYLLVYNNKAIDWDERGHRIGFEGTDFFAGFRPQWHHVFPKKLLENKISPDLIDALANIAAIGNEINIRISAKKPMDYIARYNITVDKLAQQFINEDIVNIGVDGYESWLNSRAQVLADAANDFLDNLYRGL